MKFNLVYTDFPWKYNARNREGTKFGSGMTVYDGMSVKEILATAENINNICDDNCVIASWTVGAKLDQYFLWVEEMKKYGFRHVTKLFSWVKVSKSNKPRALPGFYSLSNTEDLFLMVRGSMPVIKKGEYQILGKDFDWIEDEIMVDRCQQPHSKKPEYVRDKLVTIFGDIPRVELFARTEKKQANGWVNVGNDVQETQGLDIFKALRMLKEDSYL